jgi:hypothetical protein
MDRLTAPQIMLSQKAKGRIATAPPRLEAAEASVDAAKVVEAVEMEEVAPGTAVVERIEHGIVSDSR